MQAREPYFVYVDEAGDRGWGGASSPFFVIAAVVIKAADDPDLRVCLDQLIFDLKKPGGQVLHWAENIRSHPDRKHVARLIGRLPMTCIAVAVDKQSLMGTGSGLRDHAKQYNYPVRRMLERVSWYVDRHHGIAKLSFAHVRRFKYDTLKDYLDLLRQMPTDIRWRAIKGRYPAIEQPDKIRGLQVADLVAGCVFAAVRPDVHGDQEPCYLRELAPRLWGGPTRKLHTYGLHIVGKDGRSHEQFAWWDDISRAAGC